MTRADEPWKAEAGANPLWRRVRRWMLGVAASGFLGGAIGLPLATQGWNEVTVVDLPTRAAPQSAPAPPVAELKLMSLNLAHGRGNGFHQALQKKATIRSHLDEVAGVLRREGPDVGALQEADGPSIWSGQFNHVEHLARAAEIAHLVRGEHVRGLKLSYGTAILSRLPLGETASVTFAPSPPTLSKGFTLARIAWPGRPDLLLDVASVHLDFSRESVRNKQVQRLVEVLATRQRPLVVMGDFNTDWSKAHGSLRRLAEQLGLRAYEPAAPGMETFPGTQRRLDWILISAPLEFVKYDTLSDCVSDHCGVLAVIKASEAGPRSGTSGK